MTQAKAEEDNKAGNGAQQRAAAWVGVALARAFGGAILFSLPILMTQEMWYLGFYMSRLRLALFLILSLPLLVGLAHYAGFQNAFRR